MNASIGFRLPRPVSRLLSAVAAVALATAGLLALAPVGAASAASPASCSFATVGTGTYAKSLCWFDMSAYDPTVATTAGGQSFTAAVPGGYTLSYTMTVSGRAIAATALPTWSGAYLGNNSHYTGVAGKPALYHTANGSGTTTMTLSNITMTDRNGAVVTAYALVGADAESSDNGESITWTSSAPIDSLTANAGGNGLGNACAGGFTGVGTTSVTCTGQSTGTKTGTPILSSTHPATFAQSMGDATSGRQGVAFGVLISSVQLNKTVTSGYAGDSFGISVANGSTVLGSSDTNGGTSASTGYIPLVADTGATTLQLAESASAGSLSNYDHAWACTRNGAADASLPSGAAGASADVQVGIGDVVDCTITNTGLQRGLTLQKHAGTPVDVNGDGLVDAGDTIPYTFTVTNSGQVPMTNIVVDDPKAGPATCQLTVLAVGQSETCSADQSYTITAADVSAGSVVNTASATGTAVGNSEQVTSNTDTATTPTQAPAPGIGLVKSADLGASGKLVAGQTLTYHFDVENKGNVALNGIAIADGPFTRLDGTAPAGSLSAVTCPDTTLAVGGQMDCTATYAVQQSDVDAGGLTNSATASGTPTGSTTPVVSAVSEVDTSAPAAPELTLDKTANPATVTKAGQKVVYSFRVENTGNVTISAVQVNEGSFTGTGTISAIVCPTGALVPGQVETCTADYTVTQQDVDAGQLTNTAAATGLSPQNATVTSKDSTATLTVPRASALTLVKTAKAASYTAGQALTYDFQVTNTGNVTVTDPVIDEGSFSGSGTLSAVTCPASTSIAPGQSVTCTAGYTITAADVAQGSISNTATATASAPEGVTAPTSNASTAQVVTATAPGGPTPPGGGPSDPSGAGQPSDPAATGSGQNGHLASTGSDSIPGIAAALALLVSGVIILAITVRRRRSA
ncbi:MULTISPECIES: hypothetical protein [unclassified Leifsonia]|uniref:beta strand repeat-containing protein n=1 Tax=unclassified Leifsonia TaxID=2663824 RepID=UPI0008A76FE9|nr:MULTISPECIES: hypothetical protein [unclassified Leifsonia]SEH56565.1 conserved repeat domain-containing protein [Leifsonia sp. CL154]SFL22385.1 conserved repeat domain-containing protein [Leifsonia sp. CL147]